MRFLPALLLSAMLASPALAQTTIPVQPVPGAIPTTVTQPLLPTPNSTTGPLITTAPADEIGYDAKVKRDPSGKAITDTKTNNNLQGEYKNLRTDSNNLRSDRATFYPPAATPPAPQKPPIKVIDGSVQLGGGTSNSHN